MTLLTQRNKGPYSTKIIYHDAILQTGGISINADVYGSALDRIYDVRGFADLHLEVENTGGTNGLVYTIQNARKEFTVATELVDGDFDEEIKADTIVGASVAATGTVTCVSVVGGVRADGTVTLLGVLAGDTITVNGLLYTAVAGAKANNEQFSIDGTDTVDAADLVDSITNDIRVGTLNDLTAANTLGVVTMTQTITGTGGNATTLVSSDGTRLAVSGAVFTGGLTGDITTINGLVYTAVVGVKVDDTEFSKDTSDNATATDLALSVTNDGRTGTLNDVTGNATTNVVTLTQTVVGEVGNATTLSSSDGATLAVSGSLFTGGVNTNSIDDIQSISPETTAIRVRYRRETTGQSTTMSGIVNVN